MSAVSLRFDDAHFQYEPYPIGLARNVLPADYFAELVAGWPPTELFEFKAKLGNKYSLSEVNHPRQYYRYVKSQAAWRRMYDFVKSREFLHQVIAMLFARNIDVGLGGQFLVRGGELSLMDKLKVLKRTRRLSARFEFSMLPADGGYIKPHTDSPEKIITLVLAMMAPGEWNDSFGGGTDVLKPRDITRNYNYMNKQFEFDQMERIATFPFEPNQAVVFVKTFNSWHSVQPIEGRGSPIMRKTLTINIETP